MREDPELDNNLGLTFQESFVMPLCSEFEDSSSEQIKLDSHLGGHSGVYDGGKFVGSEDPQWVVPKIKDRDELKSILVNQKKVRNGGFTLLSQIL